MDAVMLWLAAHFTEAPQLLATQALMITWSVADLVLIATVLRIADLARAAAGRPRIRVRYALLAVTALLTPGLAFVESIPQIFLLESGITVPQYLILIASLVSERTTLLPLVERQIAAARSR